MKEKIKEIIYHKKITQGINTVIEVINSRAITTLMRKESREATTIMKITVEAEGR